MAMLLWAATYHLPQDTRDRFWLMARAQIVTDQIIHHKGPYR
jgi:hypothetical protein